MTVTKKTKFLSFSVKRQSICAPYIYMKNFFFRSRTLRELKRFFKENAAQGKPLCLMDDLVFKAMFTSDSDDSREALRRLLGACIKREISSVRVINNELIPAHLDSKAVRLEPQPSPS